MKKKKSLLKRMVAILLSLVMVAGMFMWNRMDVKAADYDWEWDGNDGILGGFRLERVSDGKRDGWTFPVRMNSGQKVCVGSTSGERVTYTVEYYLRGESLIKKDYQYIGGPLTFDIGEPQECAGYTEWLMTPVYESESSKKVWKWELRAVIEEASSTGGQSDAVPHTHSFKWMVTKEPTGSEDGLEEYKCKMCGAVEASQPISANMAKIRELCGLIKNTPQNGSVTYEFGNLATISDYILVKMAERNDVAVTVSFTYNGEAYSITFPAGTDYTELLNDSEHFYGLLGLNGRYGVSVSPIGSGA